MSDTTTDEGPSPAPYELAPGQAENSTRSMGTAMQAEVERLERLAEEAEAGAKRAEMVTEETGAQILRDVEENGGSVEAPPPPSSLFQKVMAELLLKMSRAASDWEPHTAVVGPGRFTQIAGRRPGRASIALWNPSASIAIFRSEEEAAEGFSIDGSGPGNTLAAGASIALDTEGPVYITGTTGATVNVTETYYDRSALEGSVELLARDLRSGEVEQSV